MPSEREAAIFSAAPLEVVRGRAPRVTRREPVRHHGNAGEGLRRRCILPRNVALRNGALLDGNERRPGEPIQHEHTPHLRRDRDRGCAVLPREEGRLRGDVVVPEVVVHDLKSPDELAGGRPQGDDRVGPPVVALADAAVVIRARAPRRDEDESALRDRPTASTMRCRRRCAASVWLAQGIGSQDQRRAPERASKARTMPRSRSTARLSPMEEPTMTRSPGDGGRRGHLVLPEIAQVDAASQIDLPVDAEVPARRPRRPVQGDETRIEGAHEDAQTAPRTGRGHRIAPGRDPARRDLGVVPRAIELDVVLPELRAGPGIERDDLVERRAEEQLALDENRRGLERRFPVERRLRLERARAMGPGHPELRDVRPIDLGERRIAAAAGIIAVIRPRGIGGGLCIGEGWEPEERDREPHDFHETTHIVPAARRASVPGRAGRKQGRTGLRSASGGPRAARRSAGSTAARCHPAG